MCQIPVYHRPVFCPTPVFLFEKRGTETSAVIAQPTILEDYLHSPLKVNFGGG